jgi:imidazoleglycerol-phosphate dehydratase
MSQRRTAQISRTTNETDISLSLSLDGAGGGTRSTGVGFFDHMLDAFARHGGLDLDVQAQGDLETGAHHTVEDVGLVIGQAVVPMDEARASATIDISGRPFTAFEGDLPPLGIAGFDEGLAEEFFRALASTSKLTLHVRVEAGRNGHHMVEAAFKAVARALRQAASIDPYETGVPSTKGLL